MNENDAVVEPTDFWYIDSKYHIHCEEFIEGDIPADKERFQ